MCIRNDFYTLGDTEEYNNMFDFIIHHEPTPDNIWIVANDIARHSDLESYGQNDTENIESIMFLIEREAVNTFYRIGK